MEVKRAPQSGGPVGEPGFCKESGLWYEETALEKGGVIECFKGSDLARQLEVLGSEK
jgi:hypothetical protein